MQGKIGILQGDITQLAVDAIVNAANSSHGCKTGQAKMTKGYQLPAKHIIHTVGPVWQDGNAGEPELLASCHRESLKLMVAGRLKTIAFPAISCGIYGYPIEQAANVALQTVAEFLRSPDGDAIDGVSFVCFSDAIYDAYVEAFGLI
jgi:O-acetyl-ADP-ribose deacetylase